MQTASLLMFKRERSFVKTLTGKGTFTKQDIETEFKSVSPVMVCSNEAILLVLKAFTTITYDKRKKQYKVGKNSNSIVSYKIGKPFYPFCNSG
ncbi:hypothetical protein N9E63_04015 [Polaribacter sp.]|nr:hypothetical protein [Polaribacter sp.]